MAIDFNEADKDKSGSISAKELIDAAKAYPASRDSSDVKKLRESPREFEVMAREVLAEQGLKLEDGAIEALGNLERSGGLPYAESSMPKILKGVVGKPAER